MKDRVKGMELNNVAKGIIAVVIVVLIAAVALVMMNTGEVNDVIIILHDNEYDSDGDGYVDGIKVEYHVSAGGFSAYNDKGDLWVEYEGEKVYHARISCKDGDGEVGVPYTDFVMGNGNYDFIVSFGGKDVSRQWNADWVIEYLDIEKVDLRTSTSGASPMVYCNVTLGLYATSTKEAPSTLPENIDIGIDILRDGNVVWHKEEHISTLERMQVTYNFQKDYGLWERGNYTLRAKVTNLNVKDDSDVYEVTIEDTKDLDASPIVKVTTDTTEINSFDTKVSFDASASMDDGTIRSYSWFLGYEVNPDEGEVVYTESAEDAPDGAFDGKYTHDFSDAPRSTTKFNVRISVMDDKGQVGETSVVITKTVV